MSVVGAVPSPRTAKAGCQAALGRRVTLGRPVTPAERPPPAACRVPPRLPSPPLTNDGSLVALRQAAAQHEGGCGGAAEQEEEEGGGGREGRKACEAPHAHTARCPSEAPAAAQLPAPRLTAPAPPRPAYRRGARWER